MSRVEKMLVVAVLAFVFFTVQNTKLDIVEIRRLLEEPQ